MRLTVNGSPREVAAGTLADALDRLGLDAGRKGVAVAVNGEVVRRGEWATRLVAEGDRLEVLTAVQGG